METEQISEPENNNSVDAKAEEFRHQSLKYALDSATALIKAVLLFNGGAAVAILTFFGGVIQAKDESFQICFSKLQISLSVFVAGSTLALVCLLISFLASAANTLPNHKYNEGYDIELKSLE